MVQRCLILFPNGDIAIHNLCNGERIYHKSYDCGDELLENLKEAYAVWNDWPLPPNNE